MSIIWIYIYIYVYVLHCYLTYTWATNMGLHSYHCLRLWTCGSQNFFLLLFAPPPTTITYQQPTHSTVSSIPLDLCFDHLRFGLLEQHCEYIAIIPNPCLLSLLVANLLSCTSIVLPPENAIPICIFGSILVSIISPRTCEFWQLRFTLSFTWIKDVFLLRGIFGWIHIFGGSVAHVDKIHLLEH